MRRRNAAIDRSPASQKPSKSSASFEAEPVPESALKPRLVVRHALAEVLAEHGLQVGEALIAHGLREADQRRGLHVRLGRDRRGGAERDLVGMADGEGRHLRQPLRQALAARHDFGPQPGKIPRRFALHRQALLPRLVFCA